jgi:vacuolar-type H+-ATPase subunit E/Vma4
MATQNSNSPEVLSREILAAAGRECDELLHRARQTAESLLAAATAEAARIRREKLDAARAEATRQTELVLATIPVEAGRLRAARTEALLENIRETARHQLESCHFDGHETVVALAAEAIRRMPGTDFVLKLSAADHTAFGDKLPEETRQRAGHLPLKLTAVADPTVTDGGVIVQDAGGLRIWDNRLLPRLDRLWPELRRQIALRTGLVEKNTPTGGAA